MRPSASLYIFLYLAACADVPSPRQPAGADRATAQSFVDQVQWLQKLARTPDDSEALLEATNGIPVTDVLAQHAPLLGNALPDCLVTTPVSATFTDCELGEHFFDGSLSFTRERLSARLVHVFVPGLHEHGATTVEATLTQGASISGSFEVSVVWTSGDEDSTYDAIVRVDELVFDSTGCAIGGAMSVLGSNTVQDSTQTFWFGPNCGDLLVAP